jgi:predicted ArsR family transcriptional regulator
MAGPGGATTLQEQARALGDPTRHAIFRYVAEAAGPVGIAELTGHFRFNHNAIRQHLAKLVEAQLVAGRTVQVGGPGRPRLVYVVDPSAESRWGVPGPYERLSLLLAEVVRTGESPVEVGRRAGRRLRVGPPPGGDGVVAISDAMERQGFDPEVCRRRGGAEVVLRTCPFASTALADPDTVCSLHLGMAEGLAGETDDVTVTELVARDPRRARCRLRLQVG